MISGMALESRDFGARAVSPMKEIGAYEALWDEWAASFKSISEKFSAAPGAVPSDFVSSSKASEYAAFVLKRFQDALVKRFGVRIHGTGEYPEKLRDAAHPVVVVT